jgi:beta-xylosidase
MFIQPFQHTIPVGSWRHFLILVSGLLLLIPIGIGRQRTPAYSVGMDHWQVQEPLSIRAAIENANCDRLGWFPTGFGLKDHSVFRYDGFYYIVSIRIPDEKGFAYARSTDLCNWEDLGLIINERVSGEGDEFAIWAPFVWNDNGIFYLYYTGVSRKYTQSIMLAVSDNPADPGSWKRLGTIFQPDHLGTLWKAGRWADCRDATILKVRDVYHMFYTGRDATGPIVGLAISEHLVGPWYDRGSILDFPRQHAMAESPTVVSYAGAYYLIYNNTRHGEEYRIGLSITGPWSDAFPLFPGWAHEIWVGQNGLVYTSYLQDYEITIDRIGWDTFYNPPRLFVGSYRIYIPTLRNP